jgi:hypothetical protein
VFDLNLKLWNRCDQTLFFDTIPAPETKKTQEVKIFPDCNAVDNLVSIIISIVY